MLKEKEYFAEGLSTVALLKHIKKNEVHQVT